MICGECFVNETPKNFSDHVLFEPMRNFLICANQNAETFMEGICKQSESIIEMVRPLYHFGLTHVLIPLNELLACVLDKIQLKWWNNNLSGLKNYTWISRLQKQFHEKAISYARKYQFIGYPYPWSFYTSVAEMEKIVWDSYSDQVHSILQGYGDNKLGILIPGLYIYRLDEIYIKLLYEYTFPSLKEIIQKYDDYTVASNKYEVAAIKLIVHMYASELGWRYFQTFSYSLRNILSLSEEELACMRYQEYKKIVLCDDGQAVIASYLPKNWVHQLWMLTRYIKKYQLKGYSERALDYSMPILMQCIGLNDDAIEYLLDTLDQLSIKDKSSEIFLLSLYRAVSVNRFQNRTNIISIMEKIFTSNHIPVDLICVQEDILKFYKMLSNELPKRFQKEMLAELVTVADESDKVFYELYLLYPEAHIDDIEHVKWLYDCLFSQEQIVSQMETLINQSKSIDVTYSTKILNVHTFNQLFYALTSHINDTVRIAVDACFRLLNIDENKYPMISREVFYVYSYRQHTLLIQLDKRLRTEIERIPFYSAALQFEKIKLEGSSNSKEMLERIERHLKNLELLLRYKDEIQNIVLKYAADKDTVLNRVIMQALINNKNLTLEFCNSVHDLCKSHEAVHLPAESLKVLKAIGDLLEQAVSHPEEYQNRILKDEFLSALESFCDCVPGVSTISNLIQGINSLRKAFNPL